VPRAELACGRARDDGDGMAAQLVRPALRLLSGGAACMAASCCTCMTWEIVPPRASVVVLAPHAMAHVPVGAGGWLCEAETCRGDPSCKEPIGDAANWLKTRRLASIGLDQGP
jgi:hypothetical protein